MSRKYISAVLYAGKMLKKMRKNKGFTQRDIDIKLHAACSISDVEKVKTLIKRGGNVNIQDKFGSTPLHKACIKGYKKIVQTLIKRGGNVK